MTIGQIVWVGVPYTGTSHEPSGSVYEGSVVAFGEHGEVVVKCPHGIHTWGGPFSDSKTFESAREAWLHCASTLLRRAGAITVAANKCEANAAGVA